MDEHDVVVFGYFLTDHCHGDMFAYPIRPIEKHVPELPPRGATIDDMMFGIEFQPPELDLDGETILQQGKRDARFLGPQQDVMFRLDHEFFYQDYAHVYYVVPDAADGGNKILMLGHPGALESVKGRYYEANGRLSSS